jgi:hypothetical protein
VYPVPYGDCRRAMVVVPTSGAQDPQILEQTKHEILLARIRSGAAGWSTQAEPTWLGWFLERRTAGKLSFFSVTTAPDTNADHVMSDIGPRVAEFAACAIHERAWFLDCSSRESAEDHERVRSWMPGAEPFAEHRELEWNVFDSQGAPLPADAADRPWNAFAREHALGDGRALRVLATTPPVERIPLELDRQELPRGLRR